MIQPEELQRLRTKAKSAAIDLKNSPHVKETRDNIDTLLDYIIQLEKLVVFADTTIKNSEPLCDN